MPWTPWIWGETTPPRAGYLLGEVDSWPGKCLSCADWLIKAMPSSTFSSNCHTPSQYFPCTEHTRGRYQTTRDSLCTLEPTELFKLANPNLFTLLCLTFPAETPEKPRPHFSLAPAPAWTEWSEILFLFPLLFHDTYLLVLAFSHLRKNESPPLKSHWCNFNTGFNLDYSTLFRAQFHEFFNELSHIHIRPVHDLTRKLKQGQSIWSGMYVPSAGTLKENYFSRGEMDMWYSCVIHNIGFQKSLFSPAFGSL